MVPCLLTHLEILLAMPSFVFSSRFLFWDFFELRLIFGLVLLWAKLFYGALFSSFLHLSSLEFFVSWLFLSFLFRRSIEPYNLFKPPCVSILLRLARPLSHVGISSPICLWSPFWPSASLDTSSCVFLWSLFEVPTLLTSRALYIQGTFFVLLYLWMLLIQYTCEVSLTFPLIWASQALYFQYAF